MRIAYNSNGTIFEDVFLNEDVRYFYNTFYTGIFEGARMGYKSALKKFIRLQSELAEYFESLGIYLDIVHNAKSGLLYLANDHHLVIITQGNKKFVEYNLRANSLDNIIEQVISTDNKDTVCGANGIDIYISHNKADLDKVDGFVPYFVLVYSGEEGGVKVTNKGTTVFYVGDLSKESLEKVCEQLEGKVEEVCEQLGGEGDRAIAEEGGEALEGEMCAETCEAANE